MILLLELTLLPALHGCWVDVCLLPLTASTLADRTLWFRISPVSFLMAHWLLGMGVLMGTASFLSILRQQLRPGMWLLPAPPLPPLLSANQELIGTAPHLFMRTLIKSSPPPSSSA